MNGKNTQWVCVVSKKNKAERDLGKAVMVDKSMDIHTHQGQSQRHQILQGGYSAVHAQEDLQGLQSCSRRHKSQNDTQLHKLAKAHDTDNDTENDTGHDYNRL